MRVTGRSRPFLIAIPARLKSTLLAFDFPINIKRVRRIMREHGIKADIRQPRRNRVKEQQQYLEDNVLHRQFAPDQPNKVWVTDTTELTYGRGNKVLTARNHRFVWELCA
ncbi:IS3 family transposase [Limosilactobacillus fermentum]